MALTANFWDRKTGELIEIKNDRVVARHRSILPPKERTIVRNQFQILERCGYMGSGKPVHHEEPYVPPQMFPSDEPVSNDGPYVAPVMTWDEPNK